ncbi:MAG: hypothetical protein ACI80V_003084 [Rhodothermales bacterium]
MRTDGDFINTRLTYGDGAEQGAVIKTRAVCNGRSLVLELDSGESLSWPDLEGRLLKVELLTGTEDAQQSSKVIADVAGNPIEEPVSWDFTVRRSAVTWGPSVVSEEIPYRAFVTLSSELVNGRGEDAAFTLSSDWLSFSPTEGTIEASGSTAISFTLDGSLLPGIYTDVVHAAVDVGAETLDIALPVSITVTDFAQQAIAPSQGWTWFSTNRTPSSSHPDSVLVLLDARGGDLLKSQTAFSVFDHASGSWVGALGAVSGGAGYQIKLSRAATLLVGGPEADLATSPIPVRPGWNWLGYLPPTAPLHLAAETDAYREAKAAAELPDAFELVQNYPNPFNPKTVIRFGLPEASEVSMQVFDVLGRRVATLLNQSGREAGWHSVEFDARDLASGSYFYRVTTATESQVRRMVVLK